jgi:hypothetical protein
MNTLRVLTRLSRVVALALGIGAALSPAQEAPPQATHAQDRVVLKSGRELIGRFGGEHGHRVLFVDDELGPLSVARVHVRTVVPGTGDPGLFAPVVLTAGETPPPETYVRYVAPAGDAPGELDTGVARLFDAKSRTTLFLVGAVHVGEEEYYARLQDVLDSCDVVLFEGVGRGKNGGAAGEEEMARFDALFRLQLKLKDLLGLAFQKDGLDYSHEFWKNADVDLDRLNEKLGKEGVGLPTDSPLIRGLLSVVLGMVDASSLDQNPEFRQLLKRQAAVALSGADAAFGGALAPLGRVLIDWRNDRALRCLDAEVKAGPPGRWIALFYGAGHLPDLAKKLLAKGWEFQGSEWLRAWNVE